MYFSLVYYLFWMAGAARLALGIHPLWHFIDWTGVVRCGWFVDTSAYYYFNCRKELAMVLCFYRLLAAGITKWVHLNVSVTPQLSRSAHGFSHCDKITWWQLLWCSWWPSCCNPRQDNLAAQDRTDCSCNIVVILRSGVRARIKIDSA